LPDLQTVPPVLREPRACFVTLHTRRGDLRGCTGTLVARQPLAHEVSQIAVQTAFYDPRFPPVQAHELSGLVIEVSILTPPVELRFERPEQIPRLLRPHVDGVVLTVGARRATFLPQVWERAPDPQEFLDLLCYKMGAPPGSWRHGDVHVDIYQTIIVEEESEPA
jgi:AmmeMemoRadiSam system protein A